MTQLHPGGITCPLSGPHRWSQHPVPNKLPASVPAKGDNECVLARQQRISKSSKSHLWTWPNTKQWFSNSQHSLQVQMSSIFTAWNLSHLVAVLAKAEGYVYSRVKSGNLDSQAKDPNRSDAAHPPVTVSRRCLWPGKRRRDRRCFFHLPWWMMNAGLEASCWKNEACLQEMQKSFWENDVAQNHGIIKDTGWRPNFTTKGYN